MSEVGQALIDEAKRQLLEESWPRLQKIVPLLDEAKLWHRVNPRTNSVGNLLLHLSGNVRQWIVSGLGDAPDTRVRSTEFDERGPIPGEEVMARLERTLLEARGVLEKLDSDGLLARRTIQGSDVSALQALVHVVEHFSYHVGQITHMVKAIENVDVGYYAGRDLSERNRS